VILGLAPGRGPAEEITMFKSVGIAAQDLYAAGATFRRWNQETGRAGR
jgi:ornithine cyclodeaminase/alanine dehydrogenase-like protein (mu-crystallin family)